jgi:hypothetical protein
MNLKANIPKDDMINKNQYTVAFAASDCYGAEHCTLQKADRK